MNEIRVFLFSVANALELLHDNNLIHRDVKPENIMAVTNRDDMSQWACAKLLDFGTVLVSESEQNTRQQLVKTKEGQTEMTALSGIHRTRLTAAGHLLGTPSYMSQEALRGSSVDYRADLWSLALVLYEMLGGAIPEPKDYSEKALQKFMGDRVEGRHFRQLKISHPELQGERSNALIKLLDRMLARDPDKRPRDAMDLYIKASRFLSPPQEKRSVSSGARSVPPVTRPSSSYRRWIILLVLLGLAAAAVISQL